MTIPESVPDQKPLPARARLVRKLALAAMAVVVPAALFVFGPSAMGTLPALMLIVFVPVVAWLGRTYPRQEWDHRVDAIEVAVFAGGFMATLAAGIYALN
jgi:hypothetical protein